MDIDLYLVKGRPLMGAEHGYDSARYVVYGAPYDLTSSWRPGARYGPAAIREASLYLETRGYGGRGDALNIPVHDLGDLSELYSLRTMLKRSHRVARRVVQDGKVPVLLGGEHTFTLANALASGASRIIVFDAHLDLRSSYLDRKLCHATWLRLFSERRRDARLMVLGARGFEEEELDYAGKRGIRLISPLLIMSDAEEVEDEVRDFARGGERIYVSLDIDVLDPGHAPGVSTPEPGGIDPHRLYRLLRAACSSRVVGMDFVEVCPIFDNGQAAAYAAKALFEALISSSGYYRDI